MTDPVRIGTRGSALAVRQAGLVVAQLRQLHPDVAFEVVTIRTEGDRVQDRPVSQFADKGVFVRAIERALSNGEIDLAVHSLKDVPSDQETPGLELAAFLPRENPHDVLISRSGENLDALAQGARVGTSSVRRRVQLFAVRPDLQALDIRGNVDTRLRKLEAGEYDAIILAAAGLLRLELGDRITQYLPVDRFCPDAGQGIIAIQSRLGDSVTGLLKAVNDPVSERQARVERTTVQALGADCHSPVGAYLQVDGGHAILWSMAATEDGSLLWRVRQELDPAEAQERAGEIGWWLRDLVKGNHSYTER